MFIMKSLWSVLVVGKFFQEIEKWLIPTINDKKVNYSNSSLKLWKERKYVIELIPMKSYEKGLLFLVSKTLKISQIIP